MNSQQRAAMQMALEYCEWCLNDTAKHTMSAREVATALREALAQPKKPDECANGCPERTICDYCTAQPQGDWVDLTDDEIMEMTCHKSLIRYFEAKLKEKNTPPSVEALAQPQGEPVAFLAEATRFKVTLTERDCCIKGLPRDLGGRWVALVAAEDDCHLRYTAPPSVEAAIEATKEKAAKVCKDYAEKCAEAENWEAEDVALHLDAAIRSMK